MTRILIQKSPRSDKEREEDKMKEKESPEGKMCSPKAGEGEMESEKGEWGGDRGINI